MPYTCFSVSPAQSEAVALASGETDGHVVQLRWELCYPSATQARFQPCNRASAWSISWYFWAWVVLHCLMCSSLFAHSIKSCFQQHRNKFGCWVKIISSENIPSFTRTYPYSSVSLCFLSWRCKYSCWQTVSVCWLLSTSQQHIPCLPADAIKTNQTGEAKGSQGEDRPAAFPLSPLFSTTRPERGRSD